MMMWISYDKTSVIGIVLNVFLQIIVQVELEKLFVIVLL